MSLTFLLTQDNKIIGGADKPSQVPFVKLDPNKSWAIVAGIEGLLPRGERQKVLGPVVEFTAKPGAKNYVITSDLDGYRRLVGHVGDSVDLVLRRIQIMEMNGRFADHGNLGKIEAFDD